MGKSLISRLNVFHVNRFHLLALFTWQFSMFLATQMLFSIFASYVPRWRCANSSLVASQLNPSYSKNCTLYALCRGHVEFETTSYFHSAALEYEWVCGANAYIGALFPQIQFAGVLVGTLLFGSASDWLGRKPVSVFALTLGISMLVFSGAALNPYALLAARFFVGLSIGGAVVVVCTYVMEMLLPEQRMALRAFFNWGWTRLWLTAICYFFPDWRSASYLCALGVLPALLIIVTLLPESPTWLHSKERYEQMRRSERWIAKVAGVEYHEVHHDPLPRREGFAELVRDKVLLRRISVLWVMWFTASCCGYAIDLNSGTIVGHLFLNQALFSVLIAGSKMLLVTYDTLVPHFSRRNLHQHSQVVVILCFLALTTIVLTHEEHEAIVILVINLLGTVFIEYTWDACYLCAVETMPTEMRATSMGSCSAVARIGALFAPTLAFLNTVWAPSAYLTVVILGSLSLVVSRLWLMETKGVNLDVVKLHNGEEDEDLQIVAEKLAPTEKDPWIKKEKGKTEEIKLPTVK